MHVFIIILYIHKIQFIVDLSMNIIVINEMYSLFFRLLNG